MKESLGHTCGAAFPSQAPSQQPKPLHYLVWHLWQGRDSGAQRAIHHGASVAEAPSSSQVIN